MRLGSISLFVFSILMVAWAVLAPVLGLASDPIPHLLLTGVLMTIVSVSLAQLDARVTALERAAKVNS